SIISNRKPIVHPVQVLIHKPRTGDIVAASARTAGKRRIAAGIVVSDGVAGDVLIDEAYGAVAESKLRPARMIAGCQMGVAAVRRGVAILRVAVCTIIVR